MKLRIRVNSIRLRLTRSEVEEFGRTGKVEEKVDFGPGMRKLKYALEECQGEHVFADYEDDRIRVSVPAEQAREWVRSESVGFESSGGGLRILVEKDFSCLNERPGETEEDTFPNPKAASA